MDTNIFYLEHGKLCFNTHKVTIRHYALKDGEADKSIYHDEVQYVNAEGLYELKVNYVSKHLLLEIVGCEELDVSDYEWMKGIKLRSGNASKEIAEIASYGSPEAYQASLPEYADEYMLDLDVRLSMIEMGVE